MDSFIDDHLPEAGSDTYLKPGDLVIIKSWINRKKGLKIHGNTVDSGSQLRFPFALREDDVVMILKLQLSGRTQQEPMWSFEKIGGSCCTAIGFYKKIDGVEVFELLHPEIGRIACWTTDIIPLEDFEKSAD